MYARKYLNLGSQGTDVLGATAIHTDALGQGAVTHQLLGDGLEGGLEGLLVVFLGETLS